MSSSVLFFFAQACRSVKSSTLKRRENLVNFSIYNLNATFFVCLGFFCRLIKKLVMRSWFNKYICPSLPSVATSDSKMFQYQNVILNKKPGPLKFNKSQTLLTIVNPKIVNSEPPKTLKVAIHENNDTCIHVTFSFYSLHKLKKGSRRIGHVNWS